MAAAKVLSKPPIKLTKNRLNDYIYDPIYTFSSERDYNKAATVALVQTAGVKIQPHFVSMFSDLCQYPKAQLAVFDRQRVPNVIDRTWETKLKSQSRKSMDVDITFKTSLFIARPNLTDTDEGKVFHLDGNLKNDAKIVESTKSEEDDHSKKIAATQTRYRESSAQTSPWQPPYKVMNTAEDGSYPEVLTLAYLSWGAGLPAGMHECKIIERARIKRAWEKRLLPVTDDLGMEKLRDYIMKVEQNEWAFREKEINDIFEVRMELMLRMLEQTYISLSERSMQKLRNFWTLKQKEKNSKIAKLKKETNRELRKLEMKHNKNGQKYKPKNIVEEHLNYASELYAPLLRHGAHPKRFHFKCPRGAYNPKFLGVEDLDTKPKWLDSHEKILLHDLSRPKDKLKKLCLRESRWDREALKKLHMELKQNRLNLSNHPKSVCLRQRINRLSTPPPTPTAQAIRDQEEQEYQAALFIQKIIQGRAIQSVIYEGRARSHELIDELKSTHALQDADLAIKNSERVDIMMQQRTRLLEIRNSEKVEEMLKYLEGGTLSTMLDYLNKELLRLQDERRAHAIALVALRERWKREAAENGRRQKEERRRKEHDEMFKQIVKIHQESVDLYLEDVIKESKDQRADTDAKVLVHEIAEMIDQAVDKATDADDFLQQEEITADLIHNFVIPEVEKIMIRANLRRKQQKYLLAAHDSIFHQINHLPRPKFPDSEEGSRSAFAIMRDIGRDLEDAIRNVTAAKSTAGEDGEVIVIADIEDEIRALTEKVTEVKTGKTNREVEMKTEDIIKTPINTRPLEESSYSVEDLLLPPTSSYEADFGMSAEGSEPEYF